MTAVRDLVLALPEEELREFVLGQRWYGSKADEVASVGAVDVFPLRGRDARGSIFALCVTPAR